MAETSVYYVPEDQLGWSGRAEELAELLCKQGVIIPTDAIKEQLRAYRAAGKPFPECTLNIAQRFGDLGVSDGPQYDPIPNILDEIACRTCGEDVLDACYELWSSELDTPIQDRALICPSCGAACPTKDLTFGGPMTFARFYIFVSDCDQDEWDPRFRVLLEKILGPCREYWEVST